ncbi:hypothetical protein PCASD_03128 [Puccinia coronata f. sp. avenae]|uniref:Uncharacterized protein n=1 Tax=Puccinia coronata f. sp. avenae TaxID=200324 RepID=A0A2N5V5Q4_9BASI|nr:hypothetical protein PCASD_03128 [Puccinia coronata f. sp. avenae]
MKATIPSFDSFPEERRTDKNEPTKDRKDRDDKHGDKADEFLNSLKHQIDTQEEEKQKKRKRNYQTNTEKTQAVKERKKKGTTTIPVVPAEHHELNKKPGINKLTFTVDLKDDTFNLLHARPDKAKVPRYRRLGGGQVLGIHPHLRITFSSAHRGDGLELSLKPSSKGISISHPSVLQLLKDKNLKRIALFNKPNGNKNDTKTAAGDHFIPLATSHPPNPSVPLGISLYEEEPESEHDDGLGDDYLPPEDEGGLSYLDQLNLRKGELEKKTSQHPEDVEAWLALVSLQDEMKELGLVGLRTRMANMDQEAISRHVQGTSDLKISYLKRALREPCNQNNEKLLLAYMKAYCDQPDLDLTKEWKQILDAHPTATGLWIEYVDWKQTEAGSMNVLEMVEVYEELIDRLVTRSETPNTPEKERTLFEQSIVYLFHRCCLMLKQAGYTERAAAAFQAIMEINFFRPRQKNLESFNELVDDFETFWDSELPRIGEDGAKGWTNMDLESVLPEPQPAKHTSPDQSIQTLQGNSTSAMSSYWQAQEMKAHRPLRTTDVQDDEDPFGCVLFDDIRNLLFLLSTNDSLQALLYSFLSFVGVSIPPPDIDTNVPFFTDPFLFTELIDVPERQSTFWPQLDQKLPSFDPYGPTERLSGIKQPQMIPLRIFPYDIRQMFADPAHWFVRFDPPKESIDFIVNSFRTLRSSAGLKKDTYFQLCELSFEARVNISSAVQLAKHSLSLDPQNLVLWDAYARLCLLHGKPKKARDVYVKTLEMSEQSAVGLLSLWYSWAEMELQLGHAQLVISILARTVNCLNETPSELVRNAAQVRSPALLLRVRRAFTGHLAGSFQDDVPMSQLRSRVSAAAGYGTFQYLTEGFGAGSEAFERSIEALRRLKSAAEEEELWLAYGRLIFRQLRGHQSFKPSLIRASLHRAIARFPNNAVFHALFAFNESKLRIENHTRRLVDTVLLNNPPLVSASRWLFAIWVELHLNSATYNLAAVRGLFERALTNPSVRSCVQVWRLYIELELRNGNLERARSVVTRAVAHCPWVKELYLVPFTSHFEKDTSQLKAQFVRRMCRLVDEKCVRIRDRAGWKRLQTGDRPSSPCSP